MGVCERESVWVCECGVGVCVCGCMSGVREHFLDKKFLQKLFFKTSNLFLHLFIPEDYETLGGFRSIKIFDRCSFEKKFCKEIND